MKTLGATAEVFLTAFKTLPKKEQNFFITEMLKDARLCEDVIDIAIATSRDKEKGRRFRGLLKEHAN